MVMLTDTLDCSDLVL